MQRFLAFIPRKWRLVPWQVLLGAAATVAWWGFLKYGLDHPHLDLQEQDHLSGLWREGLDADAKEYAEHLYAVHSRGAWFAASLAIPAWLVLWASVIAIRWLFANHAKAARALTEVAAFAAMVGVAWLAAHLFSGHSCHCGYYFNEYSHHRDFWDCKDYPNACSPFFPIRARIGHSERLCASSLSAGRWR